MSVCTNLADGVVPGEVEAVGVSGLSDTSSRLHLLLFLIEHHLWDNNIVHVLVRGQHIFSHLALAQNLLQTSEKPNAKCSRFSFVPVPKP